MTVGRSTIATEEALLSRTHEAPSLLIDRDDPDAVYLAEVELQAGECRFYVSDNRGPPGSGRPGPPSRPSSAGWGRRTRRT